MRSAYKAVHGREPEFTNFAQSKNAPEAFKGCLDYIFVSDGPKVVNCPPVPAAPFVLPLPSKTEPSDHLLLEATLEFEKKGKGTDDGEKSEPLPSKT